jgi:hypothetical protein
MYNIGLLGLMDKRRSWNDLVKGALALRLVRSKCLFTAISATGMCCRVFDLSVCCITFFVF